MTKSGPAALHEVDGALLEALRAGDVRAFRRLFEAYQGTVLAASYSITGDWASAEDTCQEVFLKVHQNIERFQAGTNMKAWILAIAHNTAIDARRRAKPMAELPADVPATTTDHDARRAFTDMLSGLSAEERIVMTLKYREELPYRDIAGITGKAEGTLRNLVSGALRKLRGTAALGGALK